MWRFRARLLLCFAFWIVVGPGRPWQSVIPKREAPAPAEAPPASTHPPAGKAPASPRIEKFQLRRGRSPARRITPGVIHSYAFHLRKGELLRLIFDQQDVDVTVTVLDPSPRTMLRVDSLNGAHGPEDVPFIAEPAGTYEVRVSATQEGRYAPRMIARRLATPRDRRRAASVLAYFRGEEAAASHRLSAEIEKHYLKAARLAGEVGERVHRADAYYKLGELYCGGGAWRECRDSYLHAEALYEKNGNLSRVAVLLTQLADAFNNLGETERAVNAFKRSMRLAQKTGRVVTEATASSNLAKQQLDQGEFEPALQNYERSRDLYRQAGDPLGEAGAINGCGHVYASVGRIRRALALYEEVKKRLKKISNDRLQVDTLVLIGDAYRSEGQLALSMPYYRQALTLCRRMKDSFGEATTLNNLGLSYYHLERYQDARDAFLQASQIFHAHDMAAYEANALSNVGWIQIDLGDVPEALKAFERALEVSLRFNRRPAEAVAYYGMAWAERHRENLIAAQADIQKAIDVLEELRSEAGQPGLRMFIMGSRINIYEFLVEVLMEQHQLHPAAGYDVEAFEASEGARARALLDSLDKSSAPPLLSLAAVQSQVLDNDTILLEYHLSDDRSFLWAVTAGSFASFELPGPDRIEPLAQEVYGLLKASDQRENLPEAVSKARELAAILLGPVAGRLGRKRLLIVAPPALQYVPFAAFPDPDERKTEAPATSWPTPLVYRHEIVSTPSASVLAALRAARRGRKAARKLLAMISDPVYELSDARFGLPAGRRQKPIAGDILAGRLVRLKSSKEEADEIARIAGSRNVLDLRGFDANRDAVLDPRLRSYKYIHLSVHGDPELPAIVLSSFDSQGRPRDPFLRAQDIQTLGLSADLVVLGSCGSGLGQEIRGEGLVGLTQAFLSGGASRVIVGLWNLNDRATSEIMPRFYDNLLQRRMRPSAALQQAQIEMWRQSRWNAPSYWAGLVQQGEWR